MPFMRVVVASAPMLGNLYGVRSSGRPLRPGRIGGPKLVLGLPALWARTIRVWLIVRPCHYECQAWSTRLAKAAR